jgi:hypothetical protein
MVYRHPCITQATLRPSPAVKLVDFGLYYDDYEALCVYYDRYVTDGTGVCASVHCGCVGVCVCVGNLQSDTIRNSHQAGPVFC